MDRESRPGRAEACRKPGRWIIGAALAAGLGLGLWSIAANAPTFDEPLHLASGYATLVAGDYRFGALTLPPFSEMWAALPLLALRVEGFHSHPDLVQGRMFHYSDFLFYHNPVPAARMLTAARAFVLLTMLPVLVLLLTSWTRRLAGRTAACGAALALALCPVVISNFSLATVDAVPTVLWFLTFWLLSHAAEGTLTLGWAAAAGGCAGLALAAKFNMILLPPLSLALLAGDWALRPSPRPKLPWLGAAVFCGCAAAALMLVYRGTHLPLYWQGLWGTLSQLEDGRGSFLWGRYSTTGMWPYFLVALLVKTPVPTLILGSVGAVWWLREVRRTGHRRQSLWILGPALGYLAAALACRTQIGVRHVLPIMPFFLMMAGIGVSVLWARPRGGLALLLLGIWAVVSVGRVGPHQLAYFNELVGGPAQGYRILVDSNLDWGQDLGGLARVLREMGNPTAFLSYFGTADPAAYGMRYIPVLCSPHVDRPGNSPRPQAGERVLLAVSATNLQGTYFTDHDLLGWLKTRQPLTVVGYSIFLYDLTADPEGRGRLSGLLARLRKDAQG